MAVPTGLTCGGVAAPPYSKGPYSWDQQLSFGDPTGYTTAKAIATSTAMSSANPTWFGVSLNSTATSGWCRAIFGRVSVSGAGGTGEGVRGYVYINVASAAGGTGVSSYYDTKVACGITGLGAAFSGVVQIPAGTIGGGTITALNLAVNSASDASTMAGCTPSMIRIENQGDATGANTVDTQMNLLNISGFDAGDNNMIRTNTAGASHGLRCIIDGTRYDILCTTNHS